jgi:hypothetical protein
MTTREAELDESEVPPIGVPTGGELLDGGGAPETPDRPRVLDSAGEEPAWTMRSCKT